MKPAFSTVACPDWTLARMAGRLEAWGYLGVELRTFGNGSTQFAFDPALTSPEKIRGAFAGAGVEICSLGTSIRFDAAVTPSVIGRVISDTERSVREAKGMIDLAIRLECPFVRVFGFELPEGEPRARGLARVVDRLAKAADYCRNSGVKLMLENGGSFATAVDLAEIIDRVGSAMLVASYSVPVGAMAGESVANAANVLGDRLACVKVKDLRGGKPVALGEGEMGCRASVEALAKAGFGGWVVYEFDRAWLGVEADADGVLAQSSKQLFAWSGQSAAAVRRGPRVART
jgi:sugar phosphate isomerase/epimerase